MKYFLSIYHFDIVIIYNICIVYLQGNSDNDIFILPDVRVLLVK